MRRRYSESELDNKKEACRKRISPNGTRLPHPIVEGTICTDITGRKWRIGRSAGVGGFGEIYLVSDDTSRPVGEDARHVIKVEPHHSGPLFVERNFYVRVAKQEMIDEWKLAKDLTHLGISPYIASGSHTYKGKLYRFLVLERFGTDLGKLYQNSGHKFHLKTALYIALQILDTLEYIHDKGYCHADIKDSNILLGHRKGTENQVYLLDYGLASMLYNEHGKHKEYGPDERRAHAGTIEFVNRDGHQGACSRRGDLETLGYNLLQWFCGRLPWTDDTNPAKPDYVYLQKKWFMSNISLWVKRCYRDSEPPGAVIQYLKYVAGLSFESKPNYAYCKMIFRQGIKDACFVDDGKLVFGLSPAVKTTKKLCGKRKILEEPENLENEIPLKMSKVSRNLNIFRKPCFPHNINSVYRMTRNSPGSQVLLRSQQFSWTKVLSGDPEKILFPEKKVRKVGKLELPGTIVPNSKLANRIRERMMAIPKDEVEVPKELPHFAVYTPAMLRVIMRKKLSNMVAVPAVRRQRSDSSYSSSSDVPACYQGYNYAMMEVAQSIQKRKQAEAQELLVSSRRVYKASPRGRANSKTSDSQNQSVTVSKKRTVVTTSQKKTVVRMPEKTTMVRTPDENTTVRIPEKRTVVRIPAKRIVVRTPEKRIFISTPERRTIFTAHERQTVFTSHDKRTVFRTPVRRTIPRTPEKKMVVNRTPEKITIVRTPEKKTIVRTPEKKMSVRTPEKKMIVNRTPERKTIVRTPERKTIVRTPERKTIVRIPERKTIVRTPERKTVVRTPEKKMIVRTPERKTIARTPERKPVVRSPERKTVVRTPERKTVVRTPERKTIVRTPERKRVVRALAEKTVVRMQQNNSVARKKACIALRTSARAAKLRAMKLAQQKALARAMAPKTRLLRSNYVESLEYVVTPEYHE